MFNPLKIRDINAACYISAVTDEIAKITIDDKGIRHFEIKRTSYVMDAYNEYREALDNHGPLEVDSSKLNEFRNMYIENAKDL